IIAEIKDVKQTALDEFEDDDTARVVGKLDSLGKRLETYSGQLDGALEALQGADGPARKDALKTAADIAQEYLTFVEKNPLLIHTVENPFDGATVHVEGELAVPLRQLLQQLRPIAS